MRLLRLLPPVGGCTFPENPAHSCAHVLPVWSAGVDPRVLVARAQPGRRSGDQGLELRRHVSRIVQGSATEHVRIDHAGHVIRLDAVEGTLAAGPVSVRIELVVGPALQAQTRAALALANFVSDALTPSLPSERHARALHGLWALDARRSGASLRDIADLILGAGDWPGDGEHRKSRARRLVATGEAMVKAGPGAALR